MNKNVKPTFLAAMIIVCTLINVTSISGQGNINVTLGFGFPDLINAGFRYQIKQVQLGVAAGIMPLREESVTSLSLYSWFHLLGESKLSDRRPWYGKLGLTYFHDKKEGSFNDKFVFLDMRGGREFNLSPQSGISLDAGVMYRMYKDVGESTVSNVLAELFWASPSGGISFFYRF